MQIQSPAGNTTVTGNAVSVATRLHTALNAFHQSIIHLFHTGPTPNGPKSIQCNNKILNHIVKHHRQTRNEFKLLNYLNLGENIFIFLGSVMGCLSMQLLVIFFQENLVCP